MRKGPRPLGRDVRPNSLTETLSIIDMGKKNVNKKRAWAFVAYPESLPEDWREKIYQSGLKVAISPLHDCDKNEDKSPKKPHYHIILVYDGPTTYRNVEGFTVGVLGQTVPQPLEQVRGYYRYLTHMDNPEKAQYDPADIETFNGFDIMDFVEMSKSEKFRIQKKLLDLVRESGITEYADLLYLLLDSDMDAELDVAMSCTLLFRGLMESMRGRQYREIRETERKAKQLIDAVGEREGKAN